MGVWPVEELKDLAQSSEEELKENVHNIPGESFVHLDGFMEFCHSNAGNKRVYKTN